MNLPHHYIRKTMRSRTKQYEKGDIISSSAASFSSLFTQVECYITNILTSATITLYSQGRCKCCHATFFHLSASPAPACLRGLGTFGILFSWASCTARQSLSSANLCCCRTWKRTTTVQSKHYEGIKGIKVSYTAAHLTSKLSCKEWNLANNLNKKIEKDD